jgi:hypothetical protein
MNADEIKTGKMYEMKHRGRFIPIMIAAETQTQNGKEWKALNLITRKELTIRDSKNILREMTRGELILFLLNRIGRYGRL